MQVPTSCRTSRVSRALRTGWITLLVVAAAAIGGVLAAPAGAATDPALAGHWTFDEGTGAVAADSSGGGHPLTLQDRASWGPGVVGPSALSVNGAQQYATSAGPVIDTTRSFTVSAWVNLSRVDGYQTFVSQDGSEVSGFYLQLRGDTGRFAFTRIVADAPAQASVATASAIVPQPGEWYHLAGVYNATQQTISLYVNGLRQQTVSFTQPWRAGGSLNVGRGKFNGNPVDFVSGRIDDVRVSSGVVSASQIAALAGPGQLSADASKVGPAINPTQFGSFLEEINHSGDGGIYAELIRNRDLKEDASTPVAWSAIAAKGAAATVSLDGGQPRNDANPVSLRLTIGKLAAGSRAGVANAGYWGIPVRPSTTYRVSFFAKSSDASSGPLTVDLESNSGKVWASTTVPAVTSTWAKYTTTLTTSASAPASLTNRFVISTANPAAAGSSLWFTIVSVFPPTYDNLANGLRIDLMQKLAALHPGYFRVPGGNYLEGLTIPTRFKWRDTIGPIEDRPGHLNSAWGYWSQDGMGLLEYLEMSEELGAKPLLAVWAGYTLDGTVVPQDQLAPYVQEALDEIQYATGPTNTPLGAMRAADGHPAPFDLLGVEVGNEDSFDSSGSYNAYRYPMFYDAIKKAYPELPIVATAPVTSRPMDILDDHYYNNDPSYFASNAHLFDNVSRSGPKILVGEYAATQGSPTGTLAAALGESAFLTGLERNADLVIGASYAPLLVNVNAPSWPTNLIGYNALNSYGSPSYWAEHMLAEGHGDHVISSQVIAGTGTLWQVVSRAPGHTYLDVVNDGSAAATMTISLTGESGATGGTATVLTGDPTTVNSLAHPQAAAPVTRTLGSLGSRFRHAFPANSLTVLDLSTAGGATPTAPELRTAPREPQLSTAQTSRDAARTDLRRMQRARLAIGRGGRLAPAVAVVAPAASVTLVSADGRAHTVSVGRRRVAVPAGRSATVHMSGLRPGRYLLRVGGAARGSVIVTRAGRV